MKLITHCINVLYENSNNVYFLRHIRSYVRSVRVNTASLDILDLNVYTFRLKIVVFQTIFMNVDPRAMKLMNCQRYWYICVLIVVCSFYFCYTLYQLSAAISIEEVEIEELEEGDDMENTLEGASIETGEYGDHAVRVQLIFITTSSS